MKATLAGDLAAGRGWGRDDSSAGEFGGRLALHPPSLRGLTRQSILFGETLLSMDARVKPGHDVSGSTAGAVSLAQPGAAGRGGALDALGGHAHSAPP
jgi:hypothetical protein